MSPGAVSRGFFVQGGMRFGAFLSFLFAGILLIGGVSHNFRLDMEPGIFETEAYMQEEESLSNT